MRLYEQVLRLVLSETRLNRRGRYRGTRGFSAECSGAPFLQMWPCPQPNSFNPSKIYWTRFPKAWTGSAVRCAHAKLIYKVRAQITCFELAFKNRKHDIHSCMSRWWWKRCWKPRIWVKPTLKKALDRITLLRHEIVCASPEIGPFRNTFKLAGVFTVVQGFLVPSVPGHLTHNCDLTDSQTP